MKLPIPDYILSIRPYVAGKPIEELEREYGIKNAVKLASNENPLGPSPQAVAAIRATIGKLNRYPDSSGYELIRALGEKCGVDAQGIVLGNGSDEIIALLTRTLLSAGDEVILPQPSFLFYEIAVRSAGAAPVWVPLKSYVTDLDGILRKMTARTRMVVLNVPHNPTGSIVSKEDFEQFISLIPAHIVVVVDEAYIEFVRDGACANSLDYIGSEKLVVGMRTFSKAYGLAGLRIGYGIMPTAIAALLNAVRQPFNTSSVAQVAAAAALNDGAFLEKTVHLVHAELDFLYGALQRRQIEYIPSQANFFLIHVGTSAEDIFHKLLPHGIIVRSMSAYGYPHHIRVNVGLHAENVKFLAALEKVL